MEPGDITANCNQAFLYPSFSAIFAMELRAQDLAWRAVVPCDKTAAGVFCLFREQSAFSQIAGRF